MTTGLGVEIDHQGSVAAQRKMLPQMDGRAGLADAAFEICDRHGHGFSGRANASAASLRARVSREDLIARLASRPPGCHDARENRRAGLGVAGRRSHRQRQQGGAATAT